MCGLAGVTDALDGALARCAEPTRAGRDLEGLVDASFALAALRGLTRAGRLGRAAGLASSRAHTYAHFSRLGNSRNSMRVLPSVLGFTRSRSRNSATPSS